MITPTILSRSFAVALAVALGAAGLQTYRLALEQRDHEQTRAAHADIVSLMQASAREAEQAARSEEQRRIQALQGVINETETKLAQARADAAAAADAGSRLRERIATLTANCRKPATDSATAVAGEAADATSAMLADVQLRLGEATERLARYADASRTAGLACQASYESLTQ